MNILSSARDNVIESVFVLCQADFDFAILNFIPLVGKLDIQRELQNARFYDRLAKDMIKGCIMPPITIAIIDVDGNKVEDLDSYLRDNIGKFFILDGMQRLNTLNRIVKSGASFQRDVPIFVNVLICPSMDHLLYRMITLNNGQKPMTPRHQIEIIASNLYDFDSVSISGQTEKLKPGEKRRRGAFKKVDLIKAYIAFLSGSVNIDNDKIIEEKMDELIAGKIMEREAHVQGVEFDDIANKIETFILHPDLKSWFLIQNNLIGFCSSASLSFEFFKDSSNDEFSEDIKSFENAFSSLNVSKLKVGLARRKAVSLFIEKYSRFKGLPYEDILNEISMVV